MRSIDRIGAIGARCAVRPRRRVAASYLPLRSLRCVSTHHAASPSAPLSIARLLEWQPDDKAPDLVVNGFVRSVRSMKNRTFIALGDGSSLAPLQAVAPPDMAEGLTIGAAVRLKGSMVPSVGRGQRYELRVEKVDVLGPSDATTFPIQKKYHSPEFLRTIPHLRPRTPFNSALLRFRSEAVWTLTQFFASRDFFQTHPPIITSSDCEGAGEVFTIEPAIKTKAENKDETGNLFFRAPKYLTVSSQLHLEALAQSVGNVWTLSPTFRAERSDTSRHLSEFYMLEAEMGFVDELDGVMGLVEDMLRYLASNLYESRVAQELRSGDGHDGDRIPPDKIDHRWQGLTSSPWPRITYTDAIVLLTAEEDRFENPPTWGADLQSEHEKHIAQVIGHGSPVFVTDYPREIKPFYTRPTRWESGDAPSPRGSGVAVERDTVGCFDLLVPEFCEIAGGSMREHRLEKLLDAMKKRGIVTPTAVARAGDTAPPPPPASSLDWYVDLRRWGCPPHGGFGLGFDRLLGYLSGVQSIRDTVTFPRWFGRCDC